MNALHSPPKWFWRLQFGFSKIYLIPLSVVFYKVSLESRRTRGNFITYRLFNGEIHNPEGLFALNTDHGLFIRPSI